MLKEIVVHIVGLIGVVLQPASGQTPATATLLSVKHEGHQARLQIPIGFIQKVTRDGEPYPPNETIIHGTDGSQAVVWPLEGYEVSFGGVEKNGVSTREKAVTPRPERPVFGNPNYPQWTDLAWLPDLKRAYQTGGDSDYWTVKPGCLSDDAKNCGYLGSRWVLRGGTLETEAPFYHKYRQSAFSHGPSNRHVFTDRLVWAIKAESSVTVTLKPLPGNDDLKPFVIYLRERQSSDADDDQPVLTFSNLPRWNGEEDNGTLSHFLHFHHLTVKTPGEPEIPCSLEPKDCTRPAELQRKKARADGLLFAEPIICPPARLYPKL